MKKNLKKVLSAVIAMALAFSLVPASFAAKVTLSDVADTASYATAVNTLVALNVINGYEDGTFLPDNKITRAEATKVMVAALNQLDTAEGMKGATQFTDVESRHEWATGYINAGVQFGYINGMGDGTFAPDAEVTYAQMIKMLVSAMNYDDYATFLGGYPTGYLSIAASEGITNGVNANANDAVTRAQVAQLVYNALNTPIVENTGMEWTSDGKLVPTITKMDGKGLYQNSQKLYKTLLTEYFNIYYVEGWVTDTEKGGQKKGEVEFVIAKTEMYENEEFDRWTNYSAILDINDTTVLSTRTLARVQVGDTNAADYQGVYAGAYIMVDEYDDKIMISFVPSGKNKTVEVEADLIDSYDSTNIELEVYASENATKTTAYKLAKNAAGTAVQTDVYVNGFYVGNNATAINNYVLTANVGNVQLVDTYKTDGYYDTIYVDSYVTAIVSSVVTSTKDIIFKNMKTVGNIGVTSQLTLDEEDNEELNYKILYNGEEITLAELQEDDILSIACDITKADFDNCDDFVIYVSRDVKTGKFTSKDAEEVEATIGGEVYSFVDKTTGNTPSSAILNSMNLTSEYTIYVDAFGRIVKAELNTSAAKYAIVDLLIENTTGAYDGDRIRMFTAEGESKTLVLESDASVKIGSAAAITSGQKAAIQARVGNTMAARSAIQNRVVTYKVSSSTGYIKELVFLDADKTSAANADEFKAASNKLASIYFSDATKVVSAVEYTEKYNNNAESAKNQDLEVSSLADMTDGIGYTAYGYAKENGVHAFVVVTEGDAAYNEDTRFAVVTGSTSESTDEATGETIYTVKVQDTNSTNDEPTELIISDEAKYNGTATAVGATLKKGDVIVYRTGADGWVKDVKVLYSVSATSTFKALADKVIKNQTSVAIPTANQSPEWTTSWYTSNTSEDPIRVMIGIVADKQDKTMTLVKADGNYQSNLNGNPSSGIYEIDLTDDTAVYTFQYANSLSASKVTKGLKDSIVASTLVEGSSCYADADNEIIDWSKAQSRKNIKLAVVKTLDDEAIDVLYITGEYGAAADTDFIPVATADFSAPAATTALFDKTVADLATNINVTADAITATLTEIADWSTVYPAGENSGYYVPVHFVTPVAGTFTATRKLAGSVVSSKSHTTTAGEVWDYIVRVADTAEAEVADEIVFTFSAPGAISKTYTFALPTVE